MAQSNYSTEVLADSPVAFWKLDEASGLPQDSSGNARHMTATISTPTYQYGAPFSGAQSIRMTDAGGGSGFTRAVVSTATNNIAVEFWLSALVDGVDNIFSWGTDTNSGRLRTNAGLYAYCSGVNQTKGPLVLKDGWRQIVVVLRSATWEYYQDGDLWLDNAGTTVPGTPSGSTQLGPTGAATVDVAISNLSVYDTALSAARITAHYNAALDIVARPLHIPRSSLVLA